MVRAGVLPSVLNTSDLARGGAGTRLTRSFVGTMLSSSENEAETVRAVAAGGNSRWGGYSRSLFCDQPQVGAWDAALDTAVEAGSSQ